MSKNRFVFYGFSDEIYYCGGNLSNYDSQKRHCTSHIPNIHLLKEKK